MNADLERALQDLHYSSGWIDIGILTEELARVQLSELDRPDAEQNTEHYRFGAFRAWLSENPTMTHDTLRVLVSLARNDRDEGMGRAMLLEILALALSDGQFDRIASSFDDPWFQKSVDRLRILRRLKAEPSGLAVDEAIERRDPVLHRWLLEHADLSNTQLDALAEHANNKSLRNMAQVMRDKRLRESK